MSSSSFSTSSLSTTEYNNNNSNNNNNNNNSHFFTTEFVKLCKNHEFIPIIQPAKRRIIVLGDIHGDLQLMRKLLVIGKVVRFNGDDMEWIGGDTVVVQVGDQIDNCRPYSINSLECDKKGATLNDSDDDIAIMKLFTELHTMAAKYGGSVISLLGNHELMNAFGNLNYVSYAGRQNSKRTELFKPGNEMAVFMGCTRVSCIIIGSNLFVHAGMIDTILNKLGVKNQDDLVDVDSKVRLWLLGLINKEYVGHIVNSSDISMFWNRILGIIPHNISNENPECIKYISQVVKILKIDRILVGHTPQSFQNNHGISGICNNSLWRVDVGSSAAFHGFDQQYMTTGKINKHREPQVLEILNDTEFNILK